MRSLTKKLAAGVTALMLLGSASAYADIIEVDFTASPGPPGAFTNWLPFVSGSVPPYGLGSQPTISGNVEIDTTKNNGSAFLALNWVTGTHTYSLADININASFVNYDASGAFMDFGIFFGTVLDNN